ncbi:MAG: hypothetical protein JAY62_17755 [Candidatus Thiodiazotropha endolucinida]|nr:hypothetical protein [Candidatus Thiodiazotropha taylori]MCW4276967.1 hypothetical protein [Candidatus Thiodiazotropha taylori]
MVQLEELSNVCIENIPKSSSSWDEILSYMDRFSQEIKGYEYGNYHGGYEDYLERSEREYKSAGTVPENIRAALSLIYLVYRRHRWSQSESIDIDIYRPFVDALLSKANELKNQIDSESVSINRRFTLEKNKWYACELIGDEYNEDRCAYSPIKVYSLASLKTGRRRFRLSFYHAAYPEGVRDKEYALRVIERGSSYLLAKSLEHEPARYMQIYPITPKWVNRHFPNLRVDDGDMQAWLDRNIS